MANPTSSTLPLADIHLQAAPSIWPLAWGWWLVLFLILIVLIAGLIQLSNQLKKNKAKNQALGQLSKQTSLAGINVILKRAALSYFNRDEVAGLTGQYWLLFLDNQLDPRKKGFVEQQELWLKGTFSTEPLNPDELKTCKALARTWLKALPPRPKKHKGSAHV